MAFDGGSEEEREGGRRGGIDLLGHAGGDTLGQLRAHELEVLLVDLAERAVPGATLEVQLLLHLIASRVGDLVTETAQLDEVAAQRAFGDTGTFGQLKRVEPRLGDDD